MKKLVLILAVLISFASCKTREEKTLTYNLRLPDGKEIRVKDIPLKHHKQLNDLWDMYNEVREMKELHNTIRRVTLEELVKRYELADWYFREIEYDLKYFDSDWWICIRCVERGHYCLLENYFLNAAASYEELRRNAEALFNIHIQNEEFPMSRITFKDFSEILTTEE